MENTKRDLSLDFTKPRHMRAGQPAPSLVTPILNLSTPELNKMISGEELTVLTPNGISSILPNQAPNVLPSPLITTTVTNNSNNISNNTQPTIGNTNVICNGAMINNFNSNNHQSSNNHSTTICDIGNSEINQKRTVKTKDLDKEKIEKKRERNRLAAKKCRQRKLETIDELRKKVSEWEQKYDRLQLDFERYKIAKSKEIEQLVKREF